MLGVFDGIPVVCVVVNTGLADGDGPQSCEVELIIGGST